MSAGTRQKENVMDIEVGGGYRTRDGREVRVLATDRRDYYPESDNAYNIVGFVTRHNTDVEDICVWLASGKYLLEEEHACDIVAREPVSIKTGRCYRTRGGYKARVLAVNRRGRTDHPVVGLIATSSREDVQGWMPTGAVYTDREDIYDIVDVWPE